MHGLCCVCVCDSGAEGVSVQRSRAYGSKLSECKAVFSGELGFRPGFGVFGNLA